MKTIFAALISLALTTIGLRAQTSAPAGVAPPATADTNAMPASNTIAGAEAKPKKSFDNSTPVRIDTTGLHVGGAQPVDITWGNDLGMGKNGLGPGKTLVALAAVVAPFVSVFGGGVVIVAIMFYTIHRRNKLVHENLRAMIEKGMPITPEIVASLKSRGISGHTEVKMESEGTRTKHLLPALILIGVGFGVMTFTAKAGFIVLLIGVAFLIVWAVERKQNGRAQPPKI